MVWAKSSGEFIATNRSGSGSALFPLLLVASIRLPKTLASAKSRNTSTQLSNTMKTFNVEVRRGFTVTVDETKFTEAFLQNFMEHFSGSVETVEDHVGYLARQYAAGNVSNDSFLEGYGELSEFGVKMRSDFDTETDVEER